MLLQTTLTSDVRLFPPLLGRSSEDLQAGGGVERQQAASSSSENTNNCSPILTQDYQNHCGIDEDTKRLWVRGDFALKAGDLCLPRAFPHFSPSFLGVKSNGGVLCLAHLQFPFRSGACFVSHKSINRKFKLVSNKLVRVWELLCCS